MQRFATLKQLHALYVTAEVGSVTQAAQILHVTQPTVTLQIKQLEEATGFQLVEKDGRGIKLTEAGQILTRHAAKIIGQWHEASQDLEALMTASSQMLRIGAIQTVEYLLPPLIIAFSERDPQAKIRLKIDQRSEVLKLLRERSVDMAILESDAVDDEFATQVFADHPTAFIASPQHPLASADSFTLQDIIDFGLIVRESGTGARNVVESIFRSQNIPMQFKSEFSSNVAIKRMVEANRAIGFISLHACKVELERNLIQPLVNDALKDWPQTQWCVITEKYTTHRPVAQRFLEFLVSEGKAITDAHFAYPRASQPA